MKEKRRERSKLTGQPSYGGRTDEPLLKKYIDGPVEEGGLYCITAAAAGPFFECPITVECLIPKPLVRFYATLTRKTERPCDQAWAWEKWINPNPPIPFSSSAGDP